MSQEKVGIVSRRLFLPLGALALGVGVIDGSVFLTGAARVAVVGPIMLLAPGYIALRVAFGRSSGLPVAAQAALSTVLSMGVVALVCVALAAGSVLLTRDSVALATTAWIVGGALIAELLDRAPSTNSARGLRVTSHTLRMTLGVVVAVVLAVDLGFLANRLPPSAPHQPFTSLYLDGPWVNVLEPLVYSSGQPLELNVGLDNHSTRTITYELFVSILGSDVPYRRVTVAAGRSWHGSLGGGVPVDGCVHRLTITAVPFDPSGRPARVRASSIGLWLDSRGSQGCANR